MDSGLIKSKIKARANSENLNIMNILCLPKYLYLDTFLFLMLNKRCRKFPCHSPGSRPGVTRVSNEPRTMSTGLSALSESQSRLSPGSPGSRLAIWIEMGHQPLLSVYTKQMCSLHTELRTPDTSVCWHRAIETWDILILSHITAGVAIQCQLSIQIFAQNIIHIIKPWAHISVPGPRLSAGLFGCPICGQGLTPGELGEHYTQVTSSLLSSSLKSVSSYLYPQELDFLTKVSLSVLRSPDPRLRARIGGGLDQAPRNRWEVSVTMAHHMPDRL